MQRRLRDSLQSDAGSLIPPSDSTISGTKVERGNSGGPFQGRVKSGL